MPTYAVLGATGATGSSITRLLLQRPDTTIHAFVRSATKLEQLIPEVKQHPRVRVFEGQPSNIPLLSSCLKPTTAVFSCVAVNDNVPGLRIAQDTAAALIASLASLRAADDGFKPPKVVVLSAAPVNARVSGGMPRPVRGLLWAALWNVYHDLELAEANLRLHRSWLDVTFVQPGMLVDDVQKGHAVSFKGGEGPLGYVDLAAGMIEIAESGERYEWEGVSVVATGKKVKPPGLKVPLRLLQGITFTYLPWMYKVFKFLHLV